MIEVLVTVMLLVCGSGDDDRAYECRDYMLNCSMNKKGEIEDRLIEICSETIPVK